MKCKKILVLAAMTMATMSMAMGCGSKGGGSDTPSNGETVKESEFDESYEISVISREDGSGTRGAFIELFGIEEKNEAGEKIDRTTDEASITNSTSVMLSTVASDKYAIGYVSLGSLNDTVKALNIDGIEATEANIKAGTYKVARPFMIATKGEVKELAQDFIDFILSKEGQKVVSDAGYISIESVEPYAGTKPAGKIVVAGSSSVSPVMEKLKEAYLSINKEAEIEMQTNDSSTGISWTAEGTCDIGMASRELKDSELEKGLTGTVIATDGIAVIVNHANPMDNMTSEQVKAIYVGDTYVWDDITE